MVEAVAVAGNYSSREAMTAAGWRISSQDSVCNRCNAAVTWSKSPRQKSVLLDAGKTSLHFKTCTGGVAPTPAPMSSTAVRSQADQATESALLRESLDECAQAVRELCRILRARAEAR